MEEKISELLAQRKEFLKKNKIELDKKNEIYSEDELSFLWIIKELAKTQLLQDEVISNLKQLNNR